MAENKGSYAGRISHNGAQKVEAPFQSDKKSNAKVKKGNDLRASQPKTKAGK